MRCGGWPTGSPGRDGPATWCGGSSCCSAPSTQGRCGTPAAPPGSRPWPPGPWSRAWPARDRWSRSSTTCTGPTPSCWSCSGRPAPTRGRGRCCCSGSRARKPSRPATRCPPWSWGRSPSSGCGSSGSWPSARARPGRSSSGSPPGPRGTRCSWRRASACWSSRARWSGRTAPGSLPIPGCWTGCRPPSGHSSPPALTGCPPTSGGCCATPRSAARPPGTGCWRPSREGPTFGSR